MMHAGMSVGRRRTFEEHITGPAFTLFDGFMENVFFLPHLKDGLFHFDYIYFW